MKNITVLLLATCLPCQAFAEEPAPPPPQEEKKLALAQETPPPAPEPQPAATSPPPATVEVKKVQKPPGKYFVHASFAFNVYTYLSAWGDEMGPRAETHLHPGNRAIIFQQLGFGYFFHKMFRVQLTMQIGETLTGLPDGKDTVALLAFIPCVAFVYKGFVATLGPQFAAISANTVPRFDAGIFFATGYTFKLPHGFSLGPLIQLSTFYSDRTTVAISPALIASARF